ncbi:phage holin family protein [Streptomyces otsuchiensis]|uniref:phage holin family protein n=1 Tax=Streptomyces otsuchiensis TaxID=2681388 RepID=UPI0015836C0F|nr:phage holin family protein [Streptomyces otsuchiensis]
MDGAKYLLPEDRPDYERVLDEALRRVRHDSQLTAQDRFDTEQLRTLGMNAIPLVAPQAADEYRHYLEVRTRLRVPDRAGSGALAPPRQAPGGDQAASGAGIWAVVSVLVPVLAGIAALIFLLFGYGLRLTDPEPAVAGAMRSTGWAFLLLAVAGMLVGAAELLIGAVRNGSTSVRANRAVSPPPEGLTEEVGAAREAWQQALLERGIVPFLHETVGGKSLADDNTDETKESRTPKLRFSSPKFSSPKDRPKEDGEKAEPSSRFLNPKFSSPKLSNREGDPEGGESRRFSSPKFSSPSERTEDYPITNSPGFASPSYRSGSASSSSSSSSSSESGEDSGSRFGKGGFASPSYRSSSDNNEESGSRFGKGGFASPSYRSSSDNNEESGSRYGKGGFASPKLAGSDRDEDAAGSGTDRDGESG